MRTLRHLLRLARVGFVMARHGVTLVPKGVRLPLPARLLRALTAPLRLFSGDEKNAGARLTAALTALGPSYIKLGQFLATRDDLIGKELARDLAQLQDRLPPFAMNEARKTIEQELGRPVEELFVEFGPAIAAASIAQVHKATARLGSTTRPVAVKVLRPQVERRFNKDLATYEFAARQIEAWYPPARRLRPTAVVETLAHSVSIEMDLRMEAAAISEMAENTRPDKGFRVPKIDWERTARRVLTTEWIDGIPLSDIDGLKKAGLDLSALGNHLIRSFLRHAMRDGFFHADMHQGNLFVDKAGSIVAVDFGIMGRLGPMEKRFLAEILNGFVTRDYRRAAAIHFEAGYVPQHHSLDEFAQALRAIGEPLQDRTADEISMGAFLGQLFQYTEVFDMKTRPELLLLQKTMVVVEGVARTLDPKLNMWTSAEPVVREWMETQLGLEGRLAEAAEGAGDIGKFLGHVPRLLSEAERAARAFSSMANEGLRLDDDTIVRMAEKQARTSRSGRLALWLGALALLTLAATQLWPLL